MNESFILSCCSTVDLPADLLEQRGIRYTCFHYFLDGVEYPDDLGKSMPLPAFYQAMVDGADTRTAQVNVEEYRDEGVYMEGFVKADDVYLYQPYLV